jgi:hypothetical protein
VEGILLLRDRYHTLGQRFGAGILCGGPSFGELSGGNWIVVRTLCSLAPGTLSIGSSDPSQRTALPGLGRVPLQPSRVAALKIVTWLILPVVICLSQRLSHACLSISNLYGETANGSLNQLSFI